MTTYIGYDGEFLEPHELIETLQKELEEAQRQRDEALDKLLILEGSGK